VAGIREERAASRVAAAPDGVNISSAIPARAEQNVVVIF
jgi:hypothetical protein